MPGDGPDASRNGGMAYPLAVCWCLVDRVVWGVDQSFRASQGQGKRDRAHSVGYKVG